MAAKKRILFINESLACAGGEKSLLNLLSAFDYERYDVSLQLFSYGNPWEAFIDKRVRVLPPLEYVKFAGLPMSKAMSYALRHGKLGWLYSRVAYSVALRLKKNLNNPYKAYLYWKYQSSCFDTISDEYEIVVAYAQGIPTFYVADKCTSRAKKLAWVNATYLPDGPVKKIANRRYEKIDSINAVSTPIAEAIGEHWPSIREKIFVFQDLINPDMIHRMSLEKVNFHVDKSMLNLMTLGRLSAHKAYDIAVAAAKELKQRDIKFRWYILGIGAMENEIRAMIKSAGVEEEIELLGLRANPYPYMKTADIYVQTSRLEGFGIAIAEAKILNIPVVATRFNTVHVQIQDGENGLIAELDGKSVADKIIQLYTDKELYKKIQHNLENSPKGNLNQMPLLYDYL